MTAAGRRAVGILMFSQKPKVIDHARGDEHPEDYEEFSLREEIGFAGFPNDFGDRSHRGVDIHRFGLDVLHPAEDDAQDADDEPDVEQKHSADGIALHVEIHRSEIRDFNIRFAAEGLERRQKGED